jgi:tRNA U34 5-methylaminomethyl-2-thiouridine-forming methyltransferase MnmC
MDNNDYRLIKTEDGSYTVFNEVIKEAMHSMTGAYSEALQKHLIPSELLNKTKSDISVLDVGFGLGYNILALLYEATKSEFRNRISIISFERDRSFGECIHRIQFDDERDEVYKKIITAYDTGKFESKAFTIDIKFG